MPDETYDPSRYKPVDEVYDPAKYKPLDAGKTSLGTAVAGATMALTNPSAAAEMMQLAATKEGAKEALSTALHVVPIAGGYLGGAATLPGPMVSALGKLAAKGPGFAALAQGIGKAPGSFLGGAGASMAADSVRAAAELPGAPQSGGEALSNAALAGVLQTGFELIGPFASAGRLALQQKLTGATERSATGQTVRMQQQAVRDAEAKAIALQTRLAEEAGKKAEAEFHNDVVAKTVAGIGPLKGKAVGPVEAARVKSAVDATFKQEVDQAYDAVKEAGATVRGGVVDVAAPVSEFVSAFKAYPRGSSIIAKLNEPTEGMTGLVKAAETGLGERRVLTGGASDIARFVAMRPAELRAQPFDAVVNARSSASQMSADPRFTPDEQGMLKGLVKGLDGVITTRMAEAGPAAATLWKKTLNMASSRSRVTEGVMYETLKKEPDSLAHFLLPNDPGSAAQLKLMLTKTGRADLVPQINRDFTEGLMYDRKGNFDLGGFADRLDQYGPTVRAWFKGGDKETTIDNLRRISQRVADLEGRNDLKSKFAVDQLQKAVDNAVEHVAKSKAIASGGQSLIEAWAGHRAGGVIGAFPATAQKIAVKFVLNAADNPKNIRALNEAITRFQMGDTRGGGNMVRALVMAGIGADAAGKIPQKPEPFAGKE